ncbi:MAG: acyl-CoA dehydratase activase-related protein [Candidatus Woesearchaeota archaeon]
MAEDKKLRIGIPRALFYYNYAPLYETFFREIGCEVIISEKTNRKILSDGLSASNNELCLPIKLLYGHVINLKNRVDYIFLPYIISTHQGSYICPKLIGAPDMVKANMSVKLLSVDIDMNSPYSSFLYALREIAFNVDANPLKIYNAYTKAVQAQEQFDKHIKEGARFEDALRGREKHVHTEKTIAVIGHSYTFNDEYTSSDLIQKLEKKNIRIFTSDMLTFDEVKTILAKIHKKTHWNLGNRILAATIKYSSMKDVDGIIYMTPFSCSSDSLVKEYMEVHVAAKPFMTLTVDEHSGDVGVITRLEAFLDMIERKKIGEQKKDVQKGIKKNKAEKREEEIKTGVSS